MRPIWPGEEIRPEETLWRYFRTDRLISALRSGSLHFPAAQQFEDPFEGAVAVLPHDWPVDPLYPDLDPLDEAFAELRRLTKISCWHRADYECNAMWKLYAADRKGVAIQTTAQRLQEALLPFRLAPKCGEEEPQWGAVRYVDLHKERLNVSMEQMFFFKHRAFEFEREFRVVISVRQAEEFGVPVPADGIDVPFLPEKLIDRIHLGPQLSREDRDAIIRASESIGLQAGLVTSTLLGKPRYH
ncbi:MAG: DUF2971 domain-containing protein [Phycisphaerae bacterium]|nr:DUF2971 domain-containing protein [Phycisphaerae bacterium]